MQLTIGHAISPGTTILRSSVLAHVKKHQIVAELHTKKRVTWKRRLGLKGLTPRTCRRTIQALQGESREDQHMPVVQWLPQRLPPATMRCRRRNLLLL